jgi:DNA mismatch endonuclease (patch repair protein)
MADVFSREKRSSVMACVHGADTTPERQVRLTLFAMGYRYRLHVKSLPGRPDIVLPKHRIVIRVNGCFWHGHPCPNGRLPASNRTYWRPKIAGNVRRDKRTRRQLRAMGWQVLTLWECDLRRWSSGNLSDRLKQLLTRAARQTERVD